MNDAGLVQYGFASGTNLGSGDGYPAKGLAAPLRQVITRPAVMSS